MTMAISKAAEDGRQGGHLRLTGNTSASAAAYARKAGMTCAVLVPEGKIAMGKLARRSCTAPSCCRSTATSTTASPPVPASCPRLPVALVNSVNPYRIEGQKTAAFEIVDFARRRPRHPRLPVGNAGNITAYWKGYASTPRPRAPAADVGLPGRRRGADRARRTR
jgi:threonine synthase